VALQRIDGPLERLDDGRVVIPQRDDADDELFVPIDGDITAQRA
jgi:hypothetical protein